MKQTETSSKPGLKIWLIGLAMAFVVHAIGLLVFQVREEKPEVAQPAGTFVDLPSLRSGNGRGSLLREQAHFFDSAPLFLPTRWNVATSPPVLELEQRPPELFGSYPARLSYGDTDFGLRSIVNVEPESPLSSLQAFDRTLHQTFGHGSVERPVLNPRFALAEVTDPGTGAAVLTVPVAGEGAPEIQNRLWKPATFLVQVEAIGRVGQPVLMQGSGVEEVDLFLRAALHDILSEKIPPPGYYQIVIGP